MTECLNCQELMSEDNWKYCSVQCRNCAISRLPRRDFHRVYMICKHCGDRYLIKNSQKERSKYCSKHCMWEKINEEKYSLE